MVLAHGATGVELLFIGMNNFKGLLIRLLVGVFVFTLLGGKSHGVFHYGRLHTVPKVGLFIPGIPFAKIQNFLPFSKYFAILFRKNLIFNICFRKQSLRGS